ncbi:transitional endoplasmic reticulum ATPase-like [Centruroides sculpturatus]|uniref:transitional endoplasmic reticulum ATPase-like n=1 Tax=Centruroides sculpturatus TaxID=218467 RepID=UPI000C6DA8A7|nr:transitional endoplasmic reticulum ATPase-like [Centruroides sculpturatus]
MALYESDLRENLNQLIVEHLEDDNSIVRLSPTKMQTLGIFRYVRLKGRNGRKTVCTALVDSTCPTAIIRMNEHVRKNLRVKEGDSIRIYTINNIDYGKRIHVLPIEDTIPTVNCHLFDDYLKPYFHGAYRPVYKGDLLLIKGPRGNVEFKTIAVDPDPFCIVAPKTIVYYEGNAILKADIEKEMNAIGYDDIGGYSSQLLQIREVVELSLKYPTIFNNMGIKPPRGVLMYGPPGTGKTLMAKAIANESGAHFSLINGVEILSEFSGESENNLRLIFADAEKHAPAIIFIDEIDAIAPNRNKVEGQEEKRIVSQFLTLLDGVMEMNGMAVIAATNCLNNIDPALRRSGRFDREIYFGIPQVNERLEILRISTRRMKLAEDVNIEELARETRGFVGADIHSVCREALFHQIREKICLDDVEDGITDEIINSLNVTMSNFRCVLKNICPNVLRGCLVENPNISWEDIGGLDDVKRELQELIEYPVKFADKFLRYGLSPARGFLLFGPPGCGKTLSAKAMVSSCAVNFICINGPELLSKWFGETEANVREVFDKARRAEPCVLFFDEIDSIATKRINYGGDNATSDRILTQILTEMDGINLNNNIFFLGATNRPEVIDSAILRPGRLDQVIYVPLPDQSARKSILTAALRRCPLANDVDLDPISRNTDGLSGADLSQVCKKACKLALKENIENSETGEDFIAEIEMRHFQEAIKQTRPSVNSEDLHRFEEFLYKFRNHKDYCV